MNCGKGFEQEPLRGQLNDMGASCSCWRPQELPVTPNFMPASAFGSYFMRRQPVPKIKPRIES